MFGFSKPDHRSAVVVDVGSSSVGIAVIVTTADGHIENIWEHREYSLIHDSATAAIQIRQIKTALTNAFLELGNAGLKALKTSGFSTTITEVQTVIAAPWSYTITKTISMKNEQSFVVTEEIIDELVATAKKQSQEVFAANKLAATLGLSVTHSDVIDVRINEYTAPSPVGQEGEQVSLTYVETAISREVTESLEDTINKFFPKALITQYSFMYVFYLTMRNLRPNTSEICLIDVTGEATEIGIVREDVLQHVTFAPSGTYSIARELAKASGIPKEEAHSYMKDDPDDLTQRLPKHAQEKVAAVVEDYQDQVSIMFSRTGDKLTIPKTIFLHTDARTEQFFIANLEKAAHKATGGTYTVHPVTAKVLGVPAKEDTALLIAINFLVHKNHYIQLLPKNT